MISTPDENAESPFEKFLGIIIDKGEINLFSKSISLGKILKLVVPLIDVFSIN